MEIKNVILIQRDTGDEYQLLDLTEGGLVHLSGVSNNVRITINFIHMLNALNTPNGAWSLKVPEASFVYDTEVWVKGKMLSENGREGDTVMDLIEVNDAGHPRELAVRRQYQLRGRILK